MRHRLVKQRLLVLLLVALLVAWTAGMWRLAPESSVQRSWVLMAVLCGLFTICEVWVLHVQVNREAQTISLSEIPLVLGLLFLDPQGVVLARVAGALLAFGVARRLPLIKVAFNLSMQSAEVATAVVVFQLVAGTAVFPDRTTWFAVAIAVLSAAVLSNLATRCVIAVYEGRPDLREVAHELLTYPPVTLLVAAFGLLAAYPLHADRGTALLLAVAAGVILLSYRAYSRLNDRHLSLERLYRFSHAVSRTPETDQILVNVLGQARELLRAEHAEITFLSADQTAGVRVWLLGDQLQREQSTEVLVASVVAARVVSSAEPALLGRATKDPELRRHLDARGQREAVIVPLHGDSGVVGTLSVADRLGDIRTFQPEDVQLLETVANHAGVALENTRLIDRLRHDSLHDALTGLPNRVLLQRQSTAELARLDAGASDGLTVMLIDLDGFKAVNDTLGHQHGDALLREVARRLTDATPADALVARLGGDEFALMLPGGMTEDAALTCARGLLDAIRQPVLVDGLMIEVGGSFGVALAPLHGRDYSVLLKRADVAMYAAKAVRGGVRLYDPELDDYSSDRLTLVAELRRGIDDGELAVYVQPKARLTDGAVTGVEALVRWQHPARGLLAPEQFIELAESNDLIRPLTARVLDLALAACADWTLAGHPLNVAVNLSTRSLLEGDLVAEVTALLARHQVPADLLTLEITEGSVMTDPAAVTALLHRLHALGVRLSIDDFGTGYSSLSYLKKLPVHEVKIDRSFVTDIVHDTDDQTIVRSIVDLGANLALDVVAEGVETRAAWDLLAATGCAHAQGYYLSRPLPLDAFLPWLVRDRDRDSTSSPARPVLTLLRPAG